MRRILFCITFLAFILALPCQAETYYSIKIGERLTEAEAEAARMFYLGQGFYPVAILSSTTEESWDIRAGLFQWEVDAWAYRLLLEDSGEFETSQVVLVESSESAAKNEIPVAFPFDLSSIPPETSIEMSEEVVTPAETLPVLSAETDEGLSPAELLQRGRLSENHVQGMAALKRLYTENPQNPYAEEAKILLARRYLDTFYTGKRRLLSEDAGLPVDSTEVKNLLTGLLESDNVETRSAARRYLAYHAYREKWQQTYPTNKFEPQDYPLLLDGHESFRESANSPDLLPNDRLDCCKKALSVLNGIKYRRALNPNAIEIPEYYRLCATAWVGFSQMANQVNDPKAKSWALIHRAGLGFDLAWREKIGSFADAAEMAEEAIQAVGLEEPLKAGSAAKWQSYLFGRGKLLQGESLMKAEQYSEAAKVFESILVSSDALEDGLTLSEGLKHLGYCRFKSANYRASLDTYNAMFERFYPDTEMLAGSFSEAGYFAGMAAYRIDDSTSAEIHLNRVVSDWPDSPWAPHAKALLERKGAE